MSYEIFYDRAFIRVKDLFIPIVNQGSNNTWERSYFSRRDVPEKNWQVLNWRNRSQLLYTEDEVRKIAKDYEEISQESGTCFKTRNRQFESGEFERWILCGLKSAFTIEEYIAAGNRLEIHDYSEQEIKDWKRYPFSTTEDFLSLIESLKGRPLLNIHFEDNRNVYHPKKRPACFDQQEYFVLLSHQSTDVFFCNLTRRGYCCTHNGLNDRVRVFATESAASAYLKKYADRLKGFEAHRFQNLKLAG